MKLSYRLALSVLCALAAFGGPILFLEDKPRFGYLLGGVVAALLTWALLAAVTYLEPPLRWVQGILGVGAALVTWAPITLVAVFDIIPHLSAQGFNRFDPVWIGGGVVAPLVILGAAAVRSITGQTNTIQSLLTAIYRYSLPLLCLDWLVRIPHLPKQYPWLFLFTGALFLTLDSLWSPKTGKAKV
jgi:hypothetical protein